MRYVGLQITTARSQSDNSDYSETTGIPQNDVVEFIADGQDYLQAVISGAFPNVKIFEGEEDLTIVSGQATYALPDNVYLKNRLYYVGYSDSGLEKDLCALRKGNISERFFETGHPSIYIPRNKEIIVSPVASSGLVRVNYERKLDRLDIRRGTIESRVLSGTTLTEVVLASDVNLDSSTIEDYSYFCVNDKDGNVTLYNVPISSYNSSSRTLTIDSFDIGTSSIAVGDFITLGKYSTTHSKLDDACERFLVAWTKWQMLKRDSSVDVQEMNGELQALEAQIIEQYGSLSEDAEYISTGDDEYWFDY